MTEEQPRRTAGPWRVQPDQRRGGAGVVIGTLVDDEALVAEAYTSIRPDKRVIGDADANAEFIVRACNAHDRLLQAAENASESIEYVVGLLAESDYARPAVETLSAVASELIAAVEDARD
jgi:hypothetical protein